MLTELKITPICFSLIQERQAGTLCVIPKMFFSLSKNAFLNGSGCGDKGRSDTGTTGSDGGGSRVGWRGSVDVDDVGGGGCGGKDGGDDDD